jgi:hypothetical protein
VRLGDLNLLKEVAIQNVVECRDVLNKRTGVVKRRAPVVVGVRRIHRARVIGMQEDFTVVVYEGSDFEKASHITLLICCSCNSDFSQHRTYAEQREEFR